MRLSPILVLFGLTTMLTIGTYAQDVVLAGVDSVHAEVVLDWDSDIVGISENTITSHLQTVFELELRKHGIVVGLTHGTRNVHRNTLRMGLVTLDVGTRAAVYSYHLALEEIGLTHRTVVGMMIGARAGGRARLLLDGRLAALDSLQASEAEDAASWKIIWSDVFAAEPNWVVTWEGPMGVGYAANSNLRDALVETVIESAQWFANAYLAAHPPR